MFTTNTAAAFCDVSEKSLNVKLKYFKGTVSSPVVSLENISQSEKWNKQMEKYQQDFLNQYQQEAISKTKNHSTNVSTIFPYNLTSTFSTPFCNRNFMSLLVKNEIKKGEMTALTELKTFNINMQTGEKIELTHLFLDKEKAIEHIKKQILSDMYVLKRKYRPEAFSYVERMNNFSFYFTKNELIMFIPQGILQSKTEPVSEFKIKFEQFGDNINKQFVEKLTQR